MSIKNIINIIWLRSNTFQEARDMIIICHHLKHGKEMFNGSNRIRLKEYKFQFHIRINILSCFF